MTQLASTTNLLDPVAWKGTSSVKANSASDQIKQAFARMFSYRLSRSSLYADTQSQTTDSLVSAQQSCVAQGALDYESSAAATSPIQRFRQALSQAGLDENQLVVKSEDRPLVEAVLRKSGLDSTTTNKVIDQATQTDGSINLGKVFKALDSMKDSGDTQLLVPEALKPVVVQLLTQMGLDPEQINAGLAKLTTDNGDIDLKGLMSWLETLGDTQHVIDKTTLQQLFSGMGLAEEQVQSLLAGRGGTDDPMTGSQLAALLRQAGQVQAQGDSDVDSLLAQLSAKLNLSVTAEGSQDAAQSKLLASLKAKAKTDLPTQDSGDRSKLQLAVQETGNQDASAESTASRLESLLTAQVKSSASGRTGTGTETTGKGAEAVRGTETVSAKTTASGQTAVADAYRLEARSLPQTVATQVVRQVSTYLGQMVLHGSNRVTLRLNPPELGRLQLDVVFKDGVVSAHVVAESDAVKQTIEANLGQLKQQLADQGVNVDSFEVEVRQQSAGSEQGDSGESRSAFQDGQYADEAGTGAGDESNETVWTVAGRGGLYINLLA